MLARLSGLMRSVGSWITTSQGRASAEPVSAGSSGVQSAMPPRNRPLRGKDYWRTQAVETAAVDPGPVAPAVDPVLGAGTSMRTWRAWQKRRSGVQRIDGEAGPPASA